MTNFQIAHHKQGEYSNIEFKEKVKYEKKIISGLKRNTKPFFSIFNIQKQSEKDCKRVS